MAGNLQDLREQIEEVDHNIMKLLQKRNEFVKQIGGIKKSMDLPVANQEFENQKLEKYTQTGDSMGLSANLIQNLFEEIFWNARQTQEEMRKEE